MTKKLTFIFLGVIIVYWSSLFTFFTNDDFFHLKIANVNNVSDFFNFFNLLSSPEGSGFYRPLTTQVFYFIERSVFGLNPLFFHVSSFVALFAGIYLLYQLVLEISNNKNTAFVSSFLYAFSAIHFGHLYFLGTFQELGLFFFFMYSVLSFSRYLKFKKMKDYVLAFSFFILALMSKETAVVLPGVLLLVWGYLKAFDKRIISFKKFFVLLVPFIITLGIYLYLHVYFYGMASGDSYFTDFSIKKTLNSLMWYLLWSLGIPEMFVDFVGPGLQVNPNLITFWGKETYMILGLFGTLMVSLICAFVSMLRSVSFEKVTHLSLFSFTFFVITLLPVLFFPFHKFSYNLTLPSFGLFFFIATLLTNGKVSKYILSFSLITFLFLNLTTLSLTKKTHWVTRGSDTAKRVYDFFEANKNSYKGRTIIFQDTALDSDLPWSPTNLVSGVLSGSNFFEVFYPGQFKVVYGMDKDNIDGEYIPSRMFLGY